MIFMIFWLLNFGFARPVKYGMSSVSGLVSVTLCGSIRL